MKNVPTELILKELFIDNPLLQGQLGNSIYPEIAPPKSSMPMLVYSITSVSMVGDNMMGAHSCTTESSVQVDVWARELSICILIRNTVLRIIREIKHGHNGIQLAKIDDYYPGVDDGVFQQFRQTINFRLIH